jgi:4-amino-4-deoxy-L-arabinose transferase-like glycosyltransferase
VKFLFRKILLIVGLTLCLAGIIAHAWIGGRDDVSGWLALLNNTFPIALALVLATVLSCVGNAVTRLFRIGFSNAAEEIAFSVFAGTGVVGVSVLGLGLAGLLRPWPVLGLIASYSIASYRSWSRLYELARTGLQTINRDRESKLVAAIFTCLVILLTLRAAVPPNAADELIYHLPVTTQFVAAGRVYPMFDNALGNFPFLIHMIYALCVMAGSDIAARVFSLVLALTTAFALYGFCSRYLTRRVAVVSLFAFFAAGMVVEVGTTARIDVSLAGMLFVATYAMINYLDSKRSGWFWLSAMLAGFSLGIKHTAGVWLLFVGVMYLMESLLRRSQPLLSILGKGIAYALIAAAVASPWYLKNYVWFHNPVYPLVTGEVAEYDGGKVRYFDANDEQQLNAHFEQAKREIPEVVKTEEQALIDAGGTRIERHPLLLWNFFLNPNAYLMSEPYHWPNYLFLLIPFLTVFKKPRWIVWLSMLGIAFVLAIAATAWIARYLLPAYPALTIVAAYVLTATSERLGRLGSLPVFVLAAVLAVPISASIFSLRKFNSVRFLTGAASRRDIVSLFSYYRPIRFINETLPSNARVMLLGAQLSYGIERPYTSDESWFSTKWRRLLVRNSSLDGLNRDLKQQGFTHILFSPGIFTYAAVMGMQGTGGLDLMARNNEAAPATARGTGPEYQLLRNWATFTLYQQAYLETVYSDRSNYYVFKIK